MAIKYYLQPNPITQDPNDQTARVKSIEVLNIDSIVKRIVKRGTTVTEPDARAVIILAFEEIIDAIVDGYSVNTDLFNIRPTIKGVFTSVNDSFDVSRHTIKASITAGNVLYNKMATATVEKIAATIVSPDIIDFNDLKTNTSTNATKGGIGLITGSELKFNETNIAEGIFFVNTETNAETQVIDIAIKTQGKLMFIIPSTLVAGTYKVKVRKAYTRSKAIRSDVFDTILTVA